MPGQFLKNKTRPLSWGAGFAMLLFASAWAQAESLPLMLEEIPHSSYEVLTRVGAGGNTLGEAKTQLQHEASKAQAQAVISVRCEAEGIRRDGLTWSKRQAYCQGLAIRYRQEPPAPLLPTGNLP